MWLWLSILISLPGSASTSTGPAPASEAPVLWKQGKTAFEAGDYESTITYLRRLVERHPSDAQALDAQLMLGRAYLATEKSTQAIQALKRFVQGAGISDRSLEGRLDLARAYLSDHKYTESITSLFEILEPKRRKVAVPAELRIDALILKGEANFALRRFDRAEQNHDSAANELIKLADRSPRRGILKGANALLHLRIETERCARYPSASELTEEQVIDQIQRRGTCEWATAIAFGDYLKYSSSTSGPNAEVGATIFIQGKESFRQFCTQPPRPPNTPKHPTAGSDEDDLEDDEPGTPATRTAEQLKQYKTELSQALRAPCRQVFQRVLDLIPQWRESAPDATKTLDLIQKKIEPYLK